MGRCLYPSGTFGNGGTPRSTARRFASAVLSEVVRRDTPRRARALCWRAARGSSARTSPTSTARIRPAFSIRSTTSVWSANEPNNGRSRRRQRPQPPRSRRARRRCDLGASAGPCHVSVSPTPSCTVASRIRSVCSRGDTKRSPPRPRPEIPGRSRRPDEWRLAWPRRKAPPLLTSRSRRFWRDALALLARGKPVVLYFYPEGRLAGLHRPRRAGCCRDASGRVRARRSGRCLWGEPGRRGLAREVQGEVRPSVHASRRLTTRSKRRLQHLRREVLRGPGVHRRQSLDLRDRRGREHGADLRQGQARRARRPGARGARVVDDRPGYTEPPRGCGGNWSTRTVPGEWSPSGREDSSSSHPHDARQRSTNPPPERSQSISSETPSPPSPSPHSGSAHRRHGRRTRCLGSIALGDGDHRAADERLLSPTTTPERSARASGSTPSSGALSARCAQRSPTRPLRYVAAASSPTASRSSTPAGSAPPRRAPGARRVYVGSVYQA